MTSPLRISIDVSRASFGGLVTVANAIIRAWQERFPEDQLTVIEQTSQRSAPADVLLATTPFLRGRGEKVSAIIVHDLLHKVSPHELSRGRRMARAVLYSRGYRRADVIFCISERTRVDLSTHHSRYAHKAITVHSGADHVPQRTSSRSGAAIALGHHPHKRADLAVRTWAELAEHLVDLPPLQVLGVADGPRDALTRLVRELGLCDVVQLRAYLPDEEFAALWSSASVLVMPSEHEGFGLPVLEGMRQGVPVMIAPDPAMVEIAGGHARIATSWDPAALAAATAAALRSSAAELVAAQDHAATFMWSTFVEAVRTEVAARL